MANLAAGFYSDENDTIFVTPAGRIFCVQTDDLVDLPREWRDDADLSGFSPCDESFVGGEMDATLREIEVRTGETLLTEAE